MPLTSMTATRMDPALDHAYETCRRMQRRHDPTYYWATRRLPAEIRPATHALYGYVRTADEIVDGPRRPAERRGAPRRAGRVGARARARPARRAARRTRSSARWSTPAAATGCRSASCGPTCARCGSTARRCGSRPGRSSRPTWTARPARSAGSWRRCSASPSATTPGYGRLGQAFQLANFIRDVREDTALDRVYLPGRGPRRASASPRRTWARERASPELRALLALEVRRARAGCSPSAEPAVAAAPALGAHGHPARGRASTSACSTASSGSTSTCSAAAPACGRGSCPARRSGRCAGDAPGDPARRRAHAARRPTRAPTC